MRLGKVLTGIAVTTVVAVIVLTREHWRDWFASAPAARTAEPAHDHGPNDFIEVSPQALARLDLRPLKRTDFPRTIELPGRVAERPGHCDRTVAAPAEGVLRHVFHAPWETVKPGAPLFDLRLTSKPLQDGQTALYRAEKELESTREQLKLLAPGIRAGTVSSARVLELELQQRRHEAAVKGHRFELTALGLADDDVERVAQGKFISDLTIKAPTDVKHSLELQELKVSVGDRVKAGQVLCLLSDHEHLFIEGHGFKAELPLLERAARAGTAVQADGLDVDQPDWPTYTQPLQIRFFANVIDPNSQTFPFYIPLVNQSRDYTRNGRAHRLWRFRPGQKVRLRIPVETMPGVFRLPVSAVAQEGTEAYVFRQNGEVLQRKPVRVLFEDDRDVIIANDGSIGEGQLIAHKGAQALLAALNRQGQGDAADDHHHH